MKVKTKKRILKFLTAMMIIFGILNIIGILTGIGGNVFADEGENAGNNKGTGFNLTPYIPDVVFLGISIAFSGIPFIIVMVLKLLILIIPMILQGLMSAVYIGLESDGPNLITLEDIIFAGAGSETSKINGSNFLDVDFFNFNTSSEIINTFRESVAKWYYILRLISAAILLVILIYIGIRMSLSTVAQEQVKYKHMLVDWVSSLALLFLLHYIIMFAITVNKSFVSTLADMADAVTKPMLTAVSGFVWFGGIEGIFAAIIYAMMVGQIFSFFVLYMMRMVTVGFLIMISPLITITYSIDKIGDGKAQALNVWLKELVYNILIQPFHCILYLSFYSAIANMVTTNPNGVSPYVLAIVIMQFMKKAEGILKQIFHFEAKNMKSLTEAGQNVANARGQFTKIGLAAGSALSSFHAAGGWKAATTNFKEFGDNWKLRKYYNAEKNGKNGPSSITEKSFSEYKKSEAGQAKLEQIKKTNAREKAKTAEKNREEKIIKQVKKNIGDDTYKSLELEAADKNPKNKKQAETAKAQLEAEKLKAKNQINNSTPKRAIRGVKNFGSNISNGVKEFKQSDYGKMVGAATKDSVKVASAIALGAVAFGASGEVNDAISAGQFGYGLASGTLENSSKTVVNSTADLLEKLHKFNGNTSEDVPLEITNIQQDSAMEVFKDMNKLEKAFKEALGNLGLDKSAINQFVGQMKFDASTEGNAVDIKELMGDYLSDQLEKLYEDPAERENAQNKIMEETKKYMEMFLRAAIAANIKKAEGTGMELGTLGIKAGTVVEKHEKEVERTQEANIQLQTSINGDGTVSTTATAKTHNATTSRSVIDRFDKYHQLKGQNSNEEKMNGIIEIENYANNNSKTDISNELNRLENKLKNEIKNFGADINKINGFVSEMQNRAMTEGQSIDIKNLCQSHFANQSDSVKSTIETKSSQYMSEYLKNKIALDIKK